MDMYSDHNSHDRSNVAEFNYVQTQAQVQVEFTPPRQIELYAEDLRPAAAEFEASYEYINGRGLIEPLPLTKAEILDVLCARLYLLCEEYMADIGEHAVRDRLLQHMIDQKVIAKRLK